MTESPRQPALDALEWLGLRYVRSTGSRWVRGVCHAPPRTSICTRSSLSLCARGYGASSCSATSLLLSGVLLIAIGGLSYVAPFLYSIF